ncbi:hypothetical protein ACFSVM_24520 [Paenibacillus shunpengii]|uniref:Uncharacterized protein n=1 Tax=Paenibacillus shunpengii TaxID=2054424 RepID=A0ABW5SWQ0_9BACL
MDIVLHLPNWRTHDLSRWDTLEDYLLFMVQAVQFTSGNNKESLLQTIDELHHYLERTNGRSDHSLVAFQLNYPEVYGELEKKKWRLSYLGDKVPSDVNGAIKEKELPDGITMLYRDVGNRPAPF